ncbi:MAG: hypothetical protein FWC16_10710 [Defluviitaleaceae bacterium]|nr:hypothetical protein [Defluviitaleaceae bacterium]MCL2275388.1 hypothetical protein [Defluviitaleaceae bacterium]
MLDADEQFLFDYEGCVMTKAQNEKLNELLDTLPLSEKGNYREILEYAIGLGYVPSKIKNSHGKVIAFAFSKNKIGKRLAKFNLPGVYTADGELRMQFYGATEYSVFFHEKLRKEIDCGTAPCERQCGVNCAGKYTCIFPDGRRLYRCAIHSLVQISPFGVENIKEIKQLMKEQDDFWLKNDK